MAKVPNEVAKKFKALEKLVSLGISSEDEIKKLTPKDLMDAKDISFADVVMIYQIMESVKQNKLFSFLVKNEKVINDGEVKPECQENTNISQESTTTKSKK